MRLLMRRREERGLALFDVLLGMAIFALIVVIGVQNFSALRERARVTQASSDVKQSATVIQSKLTEPESTLWGGANPLFASEPATGDNISTVLESLGVNYTDGFEAYFVDGNAFTGSFAVCVDRDGSAPAAFYNSMTSAVLSDRSANCATSVLAPAIP